MKEDKDDSTVFITEEMALDLLFSVRDDTGSAGRSDAGSDAGIVGWRHLVIHSRSLSVEIITGGEPLAGR